MKIFSASQIRALDDFTIKNEPIASIDLMERASLVFTKWFVKKFPDQDIPICIFCGPGNNGGDGLAVARLLYERFYNVSVNICAIGTNYSRDFKINLERLPEKIQSEMITVNKGDDFPNLEKNGLVIDSIFGSGLNRPVSGYWGDIIDHINNSENTIVSIDIPSGLFADDSSLGSIIKADDTLSFEFPKLAFLMPENQNFVKSWQSESINLDKVKIKQEPTDNFYLTKQDILPIIKKSNKFDHKGTYGHALLIMGSYGKMGAATMAAKACLRTGTGLVTVHIPKIGYDILQIAVPEAMASIDHGDTHFSSLPDLDNYATIGIGSGLGTEIDSVKALEKLLQTFNKPMLFDADALNILAQNKSMLKDLPANSILTPHPGEFKRLFGEAGNNFERLGLLRKQAKKLKVIIILKGAHTCIALPDGSCYFNSTGNPGMATAGSGDVLSGIITSLLAQKYSPKNASFIGVYLHGLAGDLAAKSNGIKSMIAGDIINSIGNAYQQLKTNN